MLLAAQALGLDAILRTDKACYRKKVEEFFGLTDQKYLLAFIYLGYLDEQPQKGFQTRLRDKNRLA